jgi:hypothetical protein
MSELDYLTSLLNDCLNSKYIKLEDHDYIKNFTTTIKPLHFNKLNSKSIFGNNSLYILHRYCSYIANTNFYDHDMFYCFTLTPNLYAEGFNVLVKHGNLNIIAKYLETFIDIKVQINPYCHINPNVTRFIISNYPKLVDEDKLWKQIIYKGNMKLYSYYKHQIDAYLVKGITFPTKELEMFKIICYNFPNKLNTNHLLAYTKIKDNFAIEKLLEYKMLNNNYYYQCVCYNNYPTFQNQIFALMLQNKFCMEGWYGCLQIQNVTHVINKAFTYVVDQTNINKIISHCNTIWENNLYIDTLISNTLAQFYNFIDSADIDKIKKIKILEVITNNIIKKLSIAEVFYHINWSKKTMNLKSIYKNIFIQTTNIYDTKDWIELFYNINKTYRRKVINKMYQYYDNYATDKVKNILVAIFKTLYFYDLFNIIIRNKLKNNDVVYKIAESKVEEFDDYQDFDQRDICRDFCRHFFK